MMHWMLPNCKFPMSFVSTLANDIRFPTRAEVDNANGLRMGRLSGEVLTFHAQDSGTILDVQMRERLLSNCMAPQTIRLKKGAQVMLIKNMEDTLVNGSLGKIVAFMDEATFDYYRMNEDEFTGDGKDADADNADDAASQARKKIRALAHGKDGGISTSRKWPLVCFTQADGTERHLLCQPETWKIELPNGEVQAQRSQVPLILAWALSIHKAQGQTLPRVKVDLGRVFEKGQAYVALSRATSQAGLQVTGFDPRKVMVHAKVIDFYANLSDINSVVKRKTSGSAKNGTSDGAKVKEFDDDFDEQEYMSGFV
jgi:ATP-dependent DNA helicase PIF1